MWRNSIVNVLLEIDVNNIKPNREEWNYNIKIFISILELENYAIILYRLSLVVRVLIFLFVDEIHSFKLTFSSFSGLVPEICGASMPMSNDSGV